MAKSCSLIPKVRNKKGNIVDSKLFTDIQNITDTRKEAVGAYLLTKNKRFISKFNSKLQLDDNNEPLIGSLLNNDVFNSYIKDSKVIKRLNTEFNIKSTDINELQQAAFKFNATQYNKRYIANVYTDPDGINRMRIDVATPELRERAAKMQFNYNLRQNLIDILTSNGIGARFMDEAEKRLQASGVTQFDTSKRTADGLIDMIRISNDEKGLAALPEEFSHAAIAGISSPLIERSLNYIKQSGAYREILGNDYQQYSELYNGDEDLLSEEALGKILSEQFNKKSQPKQALFKRLFAFIKNFFKRIKTDTVKQAITDASNDMSQLAKEILNGKHKINVKDRKSINLYRVEKAQKEIANINTLLGRILTRETKRYNIYKATSVKQQALEKTKNFLHKLKNEVEKNQQLQGLNDWAGNAVDILRQLQERLDNFDSDDNTNINQKARVLRSVRNFIKSYQQSLDDIRKTLNKSEYQTDEGKKLKDALDKITVAISELTSQYNEKSVPLFATFLDKFLSPNMVEAYKKRGINLNAKDLITSAEKDITFIDRWLDSMAQSNSPLLKLFDTIVKERKDKARQATIDIQHNLQAAAKELEEAGVNDFSWLYERDNEGHKTGRFISKINYGQFYKDKREFYKRMEKKYGDLSALDPKSDEYHRYSHECQVWYSGRVDKNGKPDPIYYGNKDFPDDSTPQGKAKLKFWTTIMALKRNLDDQLPDNIGRENRIPVIRKDLIERITSKGLNSAPKEWWESVKDGWLRRSDDTDVNYSSKNILMDFDNNEVMYLPLYYINKNKNESWDDISEDPVSTMIAYAAMANNFKEMNSILDILELGRQVVKDNFEAQQHDAGKTKQETVNVFGYKVRNPLVKKGDQTYIVQRLNDFFKMQVFGRYMDDSGTMKIPFTDTRIDVNKAVGNVLGVSALNSLAFNILAGINNAATGSVMMRIESMASQFFNERNTITADKNYAMYMPQVLSQAGKRIKTNKLDLWNELFDVMDDYEQNTKEVNWDQKNRLIRLFGKKAFYLINNLGEHWMHTRTSLALADAYKLKDANGNKISLFDAMEVVPLNAKHPERGSKLQLKKGVTKLDGSQFTKDDITAFSRKIHGVNHYLHGIYNQADMNALQALAVGRAAIMFRKYMRPSWNRRFQKGQFDMDLDQWVEGYYRTTGRFLKQLGIDLKNGEFNLQREWKNLDDTERANVIRAITEVSHFIIASAAVALLSGIEPTERTWLEKQILYQSLRLKNDIGSFLPAPTMVTEGLKLMNSPIAATNTLESTIDLINLVNPFEASRYYEFIGGDEAILQSGSWEGYSRAEKTLLKSPLAPVYKQFKYFSHPDDLIKYFQTGGY